MCSSDLSPQGAIGLDSQVTRPWATFIELASSSPPVMARPKSAVVRKESPWRSRARRLASVVVTATSRIPPPAAVARSSWSPLDVWLVDG